jgi:hypothetical protein
VGVVFALAYAIISPTISGPPSVSDPLTTQATYVIGPGNSSYLGGAITGEDYVVGNYTVVNPAGASIGMAIYNSSDFARYLNGQPTKAAWTVPPQPTGRIVFAAPYTDQFYFVFTNPYGGATGIVEHVYVVTNYQSNVLVG